MFFPGGDSQRRPIRPRPAVCSSATTTVPCGAPFSAISIATRFVLSGTARHTTSVQGRRPPPARPPGPPPPAPPPPRPLGGGGPQPFPHLDPVAWHPLKDPHSIKHSGEMEINLKMGDGAWGRPVS